MRTCWSGNPGLAEPVATEGFEYSLRSFLDCVRALASGDAEGGPFNYFLAHEYLRELQQTAPQLLDSPAAYLSGFERAALSRFVVALPHASSAIAAAQRHHPEAPEVPALPIWPDWRPVPALPAWRDLAIHAAALLNQLHAAIQRNDGYFGDLGPAQS